VDPDEGMAALRSVLASWRSGRQPDRAVLRTATQWTLQELAGVAPGRSVEVRVPPLAATQCVAGPTHTRGTPPNTVQTDPRTWLELATGTVSWQDAVATARVQISGVRSDLSAWLPLPQAVAAADVI